VSEMNYLDLHGERIAYRDAGAGEALLLIHGMAGSSATWRAVIPELSKKVSGGGTGPVGARRISQAAR